MGKWNGIRVIQRYDYIITFERSWYKCSVRSRK